MFKKYYKEANDEIKTNRELIEKIFDEDEKSARKKPFGKIYRFGAAVAAVLVLVVSVSLVTNFIGKDNSDNKTNIVSPIAQSGTNSQPVQNGTVVNPIENKVTTPDTQSERAVENDENNENKVQPIIPQEQQNPETSEETPVLAMEAENVQGFSVSEGPVGRAIDATEEFISYEVSLDDMIEVTQDEIKSISGRLREYFGNEDGLSGFKYSFYTDGKVQTENGMVYIGRWCWLVDNNHYSKIQDYVVNEEFTEMYYCEYTDANTVRWNTSNNMIAE